MNLYPAKKILGEITVPGDKSISHRSVMLGAISKGTTRVHGFLKSADCLSTIECFKKMGVNIEEDESGDLLIHGVGLHGLKKPESTLYCGNSGTTARILSGLLCGQDFSSSLSGDNSLSRRPMKRVTEPLSSIGANIRSVSGSGTLPLEISPSSIHGGCIEINVSSAQVKSAILMAGLYADSPLTVIEPSLSRNHTELMLKALDANVRIGSFKEPACTIEPHPVLHAKEVKIPGDISSAAYFIGGALITPDSEVYIKNVGINETRDGILRVLWDMGADVEIKHIWYEGEEKTADILVKYSSLKAVRIEGELIPLLIDELPLLAVIATQAQGTTVIKDAAELRVKESDRIELVVSNLKKMGADIVATEDGMIINGGLSLHGAEIDTAADHRIAMSFAIASLINQSRTPVTLDNSECVKISYPGFFDDLALLKK